MNQKSSEYQFFQKITDLKDAFRKAIPSSDTKWTELCTYCGNNQHVIRQNNKDEGILDYVFLSPQSFQPISAEIVSTIDSLSDHRPTIVTTQLVEGDSSFRFSVPRSEIPSLVEEISTTSISAFCRLAPIMGWTQRGKTLEFLKSLSQ